MTKNTVILEIFNFLKAKGITASESEFSEHWLGCCEGYVAAMSGKCRALVDAESVEFDLTA